MRDWDKVSEQTEALEKLLARRAALVADIDKEIAEARSEIVRALGAPTPQETYKAKQSVFEYWQDISYEHAKDEARAMDDFDILEELRNLEEEDISYERAKDEARAMEDILEELRNLEED